MDIEFPKVAEDVRLDAFLAGVESTNNVLKYEFFYFVEILLKELTCKGALKEMFRQNVENVYK